MSTQVFRGTITNLTFEEEMERPLATFKSPSGTKSMTIMSKGVWQFLRLEYGRHKIDEEIKQYKKDNPQAENPLFDFAVTKVNKETPQGTWQILIKNGKIITLASHQHILYTEDEVYTMVQKRLKKLKVVIRKPLRGRVIYVTEVGGLKLGLNIYAGDIFTQHAIKIATFIEVKACFNPLTFLNLKTFVVKSEIAHVEKMLRVHRKDELGARLTVTIKKSLESVRGVLKYVEQSKKMKITDEQMKKLLVAMNTSYYIGKKVTEHCLEQYKIERMRNKSSSTWSLAMATSWIAQHGQCFEKHHQKTRAHLSTISGALLLIDKLDESIEGCEEYIKTNEDAATLYKSILKRGENNARS